MARLQVANGVVSGGTADIDQYMTAAAVSEKKLVRGISGWSDLPREQCHH
ncbi:hypothetical protein [Endozoicomonas acroporae]|nr:hypothetical protein [Endozoicomonas acroporae]